MNPDLSSAYAYEEDEYGMTSLAKGLLANSMKNRLMVMIEEKAQEAQAVAAERAKPEVHIR